MNAPRLVRLSAAAAATLTLVLGSSSPASAECAAPTYHGGLPLRIGACPEAVAAGASAMVWAVLLLAAGLWIAHGLTRPDSRDASDLELIDRVFSPERPVESEDGR
ncbi:hypothetical protein O3S80_14715 [Streptomyces sp. Lzd4kr]|nr:hypothetical protein [Streptomyces sp. Lzd4kr]